MNKLLGLLLLVPTFAFGHGTLLETVPVADSTVTAPENIVLRFNQNVKLIKFVVASEEGEEVEGLPYAWLQKVSPWALH